METVLLDGLVNLLGILPRRRTRSRRKGKCEDLAEPDGLENFQSLEEVLFRFSRESNY